MGSSWLVLCSDGLSHFLPENFSFVSLSLSPSFPLSFLASLPPPVGFLLTGGAVKFDWLSSGFDAVTSHPLREFKAIKLLQMSRHRRREMHQVVRPGASCPSPCPVLHSLSYRVMMCSHQSFAFYHSWRIQWDGLHLTTTFPKWSSFHSFYVLFSSTKGANGAMVSDYRWKVYIGEFTGEVLLCTQANQSTFLACLGYIQSRCKEANWHKCASSQDGQMHIHQPACSSDPWLSSITGFLCTVLYRLLTGAREEMYFITWTWKMRGEKEEERTGVNGEKWVEVWG